MQLLGKGSNTLFSGNGFDGVIVYFGARFGGFEVLSERTIRVGGGALTVDVVEKAASNGFDLTFLGAVPGIIGGAIAVDASFVGRSLCDYVLRATVVLGDGGVQTFKRELFEHSDHRTVALNSAAIIQAVLNLPQRAPQELASTLSDVRRQHEEMFPAALLYTGHVFSKAIDETDRANHKSPTDQVERVLCRMGEFRLAGTGLYLASAFPNIIFSQDSADAARLAEFAQVIRNRFRHEFAVDLECNLKVVGDLR